MKLIFNINTITIKILSSMSTTWGKVHVSVTLIQCGNIVLHVENYKALLKKL